MVKGFDEDFFAYYEDFDLGWRIKNAGYKCIYVPGAKVYHKGSVTSRENRDIQLYYVQRNQGYVLIKNLSFVQAVLIIPLHLVFVFGSFLKYLIQGKGNIVFKAKKDAIKDFFKMFKKR